MGMKLTPSGHSTAALVNLMEHKSMTTSDRAVRMAATLSAVTDAAFTPKVPNGTTVKLQRELEAILEQALNATLEIAQRPDVPNGTTKKVLDILTGVA